MSDLEIAIERMSGWLRDYGDKKPVVFIQDVTMLLVAAQGCIKADAEIERLRAEKRELCEALRDLHDVQNGPPLGSRLEWWKSAMKSSINALLKYEAAEAGGSDG